MQVASQAPSSNLARWVHSRDVIMTHAPVEQSHHEPALAAARLVESTVELARAEATLVLAHARTALARTVGAVLAGMVATSAAQAALLVGALSPVLLISWSRSALLLALLPSLLLCGAGTWLAVVCWRGLAGERLAATK
jgi:hypothetical protein